VSTTPVANNGNNIRLIRPESELEENKFYTNQRCQNKILKTFLTEDFPFVIAGVKTPVVHLELQISP
jgi:hypothetical protein